MPDDPRAFDALVAATRLLYHSFAKCRGERHWVDGMDDLSEEYATRPARMSAKELSDEDVGYFFSHAVCAIHETDIVNAVKYFLPRVLESFVAEERPRLPGMVFEPWFIGEWLRKSHWHSWPTEQVGAVENWLNAWVATSMEGNVTDVRNMTRPEEHHPREK